MARTAKIAVSVERSLLDDLENLRARTGETRSAAVARAIRLLTEAAEHERRVAEYRGAYADQPESASEVTVARSAARRSLARLPWDEQ